MRWVQGTPVSLARMAFSAAFLTSSYTVAMSTFA
jgi:hypothetical protein